MSDDPVRDAISELVTNQIMMMAMLVTELDKSGAISKTTFSKLLSGTADSAESKAPPEMADRIRLDLIVMRRVADLLSGGPPKPWTPVVIPGGKADRQN